MEYQRKLINGDASVVDLERGDCAGHLYRGDRGANSSRLYVYRYTSRWSQRIEIASVLCLFVTLQSIKRLTINDLKNNPSKETIVIKRD